MSSHYMTVRKLDLEGSVRQRLEYRSFKFHYVVLSQNDPSKLYDFKKTVYPRSAKHLDKVPASTDLRQKQGAVVGDRN